MKNTSKEEINKRVVEAINNSVEIHIIHPNKFNMERLTKESHVEKSLVAKITEIKNVTIRHNSRNAKEELQHTDNKIFVEVLIMTTRITSTAAVAKAMLKSSGLTASLVR
jgi:spermidine/putrescine-binding protein